MHKLSIVIPTKNEENYLPLLLRSLKEQTRLPDEVIIADAGSTDRTREIAQSFDAKVVEGGMPGAGRNKGAAAASGDLIFFLDADVVLKDVHYLEKCLAQFDAGTFDVATTDILPLDGTGFDRFSHEVYNWYVRRWGKGYFHAPGFCILVKKSLHELIGGFDETVVYAEDYDYSRRAGKKGKPGFISGTSLEVSTRRQKKDGGVLMVVRVLLGELHLLTLGPIRHDLFRYRFGHDKK